MVGKSDIEEYTHNQLEVSKIKHLKRIATALEGINACFQKAQEDGKHVKIEFASRKDAMLAAIHNRDNGPLKVTVLQDGRPKVETLTPVPLGAEIPDENPDATDLGLTREEEQEIEREVNKQPVKKGKK